MQNPSVHIFTHDVDIRSSISNLLESNGLPVMRHQQFLELLDAVDLDEPTCLILDLEASLGATPTLLQKLEAHGIDWPTVIILRQGDDRAAAQAMRHGAFACVELPCRGEDLLATVKRALATLGPDGVGAMGTDVSSRRVRSEPSFYMQA